MIKLENITLLDKKYEGKDPINFVNEDHVTYFEYADRVMFHLLGIRQQYIKDGSMTIDDFSLFPLKDQKKYAFVLNINSQVVVLNAVFVLELSFKDKTRGLLKKELQTLRDLPLETKEQQKEKITKIIDILKRFNCCYSLIDTNDEINDSHLDLIKEVIDENPQSIFFVLNKNPNPKPKQEKVVLFKRKPKAKKDKTKVEAPLAKPVEEEKPMTGEEILAAQYRDLEEDESTMTVTRTMPIVTDEALKSEFEDFEREFSEFNLDIAVKKANEKKEDSFKSKHKDGKKSFKSANKFWVFLQELTKHLYLYFLFIALFSIFLSVCSFSCIYLIRTNNGLISGILIFLDIVFVVMHMYIIGSTYAGIKKHFTNLKQKAIFAIAYSLCTIIGIGIGIGFIFILSANEVFVKINEYVMTDWILGIVVSVIAVGAPFACYPLSIAYIKIHKVVERLFPKNNGED